MASKLRSARLKIDRAVKHVIELSELLQHKRLFSYVLETNTKANERSLYAKRDEVVAYDASIICGDAVHVLRVALDHAYWQIVSPVVTGVSVQKAIQFPFSATKKGLEGAVKQRHADKVSQEFFKFILKSLPHGEPGGNEMLYLVHDLDLIDKHRLLIPTADYKRLSAAELYAIDAAIPVSPSFVLHAGGNIRDFTWSVAPSDLRGLGLPGLPLPRIYEEEVDAPVEVMIVSGGGVSRPLVPSLHRMVEVVRKVVRGMEEFVDL